MSKKVSVEVVRRVYDDEGGVYIEVGPDGDALGTVEVRTSGASAEHFGAIRFAVAPEMARALGEALIAAAGEAS